MEHGIRQCLEGKGGNVGWLLRTGLAPCGWVYGGFGRLRRAAYRRGWRRTVRVDAPVISVGNLTAGGTGKTPLALWLCERLLRHGRRPALLSRGYGAKTPADADEPRLFAHRLPDVRVVVNPDRVAGARAALADGADVLVLDDGFQHLRLARDLNLAVIDALAPFGGGRCLPAGLLREPVSALADADAAVITRSDQADVEAFLTLGFALGRHLPRERIFTSRHAPTRLRPLSEWTGEKSAGAPELPPAALAGRRIVACAAIGRPEAFVGTLARQGATVTRLLAFPDHHAFTPRDFDLARLAAATDAADLVTTEKDAVKLAPLADADARANVWVLGVELAIDGGDALWTLVEDALAGRRPPPVPRP